MKKGFIAYIFEYKSSIILGSPIGIIRQKFESVFFFGGFALITFWNVRIGDEIDLFVQIPGIEKFECILLGKLQIKATGQFWPMAYYSSWLVKIDN